MIQKCSEIAADMKDPLAEFETKVIPHDGLTDAKKAIRTLHARYRPSGRNRLKARALFVVGDPGAGKTTLLEDYAAEFPTVETEDGDIRRVVYVEAPKRTTQRALVATILQELGYKVRDTWNTDEILRRINFYFQEMKVEVLLIDEGHHMVNQSTDDGIQDLSEFVKSLLNRCQTQIVFAGLPALLKLGNYKQVKRRLQRTVRLRPYNWSLKRQRVNFLTLLMMFEKRMDLPQASNLVAHDTAKRIYCATGGHIGLVSKLLSETLRIALEEGLAKVDLPLLARAYPILDPVSEREAELDDQLLDFDEIIDEADIEEVNERDPANPFEATEDELRVLWQKMAGSRLQDISPRTRIQKTGQPEARTF